MNKLKLLFTGFATFFISLNSSFSSNENEDFLVFAHSSYHLKSFSFISENCSIGLIKKGLRNESLILLFDEHNLAVDSFYSRLNIENIVPNSDSTFFLQSKAQTQELLIKDKQLLIKGQYSGISNKVNFDKLAYYTLPINSGEIKVLKSIGRNKKYRLESSFENDGVSTGIDSFDFDAKRKSFSLEISASKNSYFMLLKDQNLIIKMNRDSEEFEKIQFKEESINLKFYHDLVYDKSYVLKGEKGKYLLSLLNAKNELEFIKEIEFEPKAIFNGQIHIASVFGKNYAHYLIPLENYNSDKSIILDEVQITSE